MEVSVSAAESQPTLWTSLAEAIRGSHQDYTSGSLNRAIFLLAVPMVLEMVLESLFAVVDVFWVGRLGANAVATVGLTESMLSLVFAVAMGLSLSTTAMVARRIGEKDSTGAAVAAVQAIALDAQSGKALWHFEMGGEVYASPMAFAVDGKQYVAIAAGSAVYSFGLP